MVEAELQEPLAYSTERRRSLDPLSSMTVTMIEFEVARMSTSRMLSALEFE